MFFFPCSVQVGDSTDSVIPAPVKFSYNKKKATIRDSLATTDLFNLYQLLNNVKVDLLWGRNGVVEQIEMTEDDLREQHYDTIEPCVVPTVVVVPEIKTEETTVVSLARTPSVTESTTTTATTASSTKGHIRRPSTASVSSSNSASTISDSESEISSNENDSGIESEHQQEKDKSLEMSRQFRCHLLGLYKSLEQMTEAANYLTARYQCDIGGA